MSQYPNPPSFPPPGYPPPPPTKKSPKALYWVAGCLGLLLIVGIGAIVLISVIGVGVFTGFSAAANSEAFKVAKQYVASSPTTTAALGDNIQFGSAPSQ